MIKIKNKISITSFKEYFKKQFKEMDKIMNSDEPASTLINKVGKLRFTLSFILCLLIASGFIWRPLISALFTLILISIRFLFHISKKENRKNYFKNHQLMNLFKMIIFCPAILLLLAYNLLSMNAIMIAILFLMILMVILI